MKNKINHKISESIIAVGVGYGSRDHMHLLSSALPDRSTHTQIGPSPYSHLFNEVEKWNFMVKIIVRFTL